MIKNKKINIFVEGGGGLAKQTPLLHRLPPKKSPGGKVCTMFLADPSSNW